MSYFTRNLGGNSRKPFVLRPRMTGQAVEATLNLVQQPSGSQARQDDPGRFDGVQIAGAQQPLLANQVKDALGVGVGQHGGRMFRLFVNFSISTNNRNNLVNRIRG